MVDRTPGAHEFIYLASQSPRRQQLLAQIGVRFELLIPHADEDAEALEVPQPGESPEAYVCRVTALKHEAAGRRLTRRGAPPAPVLCADTTVALGDRLYGKPLDAAQACEMLASLSGQRHRVLTAVVVGVPGEPAEAVLHTSWVTFDTLEASAIEAYVRSGEAFGKAGAYGIQGLAACWIPRIEGSHSGIMGLPLHETAGLLDRAGVRHALSPCKTS